MSRVKFHRGGVPGLRANVAGRSGDPARRGGEGKLELTEAPRAKAVAEGIPEGFRPVASARVAHVGTGAVEPWHTYLSSHSLAGTVRGVGEVSGVGIVAVVGGNTPFLKDKSDSE